MKTSAADKWFSMFIRLRDSNEDGLGTCCTCGVMKPVKQMDCGHFIKRQHMATRFSEVNCAIQCKKCNAFEQGRNEDFERYLIKKHGIDKVNMLKLPQTRKMTLYDVNYLAVYYKQKSEQLAKEKGIALW
jgi:hypothetical protein